MLSPMSKGFNKTVFRFALALALAGWCWTSQSLAKTTECQVSRAIYKSGSYQLRFRQSSDCENTEGSCGYIFSIIFKGPNISIAGSSTVPNGFARQFYTLDFPNYDEGEFERMGGFYFISTAKGGTVLPTTGEVGLDEQAPPAVVMPEFSRQMYYTQRDKTPKIDIPPSDIFVLAGCE